MPRWWSRCWAWALGLWRWGPSRRCPSPATPSPAPSASQSTGARRATWGACAVVCMDRCACLGSLQGRMRADAAALVATGGCSCAHGLDPPPALTPPSCTILRAVINRYGFNSQGVDAAALRLAAIRAKQVRPGGWAGLGGTGTGTPLAAPLVALSSQAGAAAAPTLMHRPRLDTLQAAAAPGAFPAGMLGVNLGKNKTSEDAAAGEGGRGLALQCRRDLGAGCLQAWPRASPTRPSPRVEGQRHNMRMRSPTHHHTHTHHHRPPIHRLHPVPSTRLCGGRDQAGAVRRLPGHQHLQPQHARWVCSTHMPLH